jgi:hypothetical protein
MRWEQRADIQEAFLRLTCCLVCWRYLQASACQALSPLFDR